MSAREMRRLGPLVTKVELTGVQHASSQRRMSGITELLQPADQASSGIPGVNPTEMGGAQTRPRQLLASAVMALPVLAMAGVWGLVFVGW